MATHRITVKRGNGTTPQSFTSKRLTHGNKGRSFETDILASQEHVRFDKMTAAVVFIGKGRTAAKKGPVDFVGQVKATGRAIRFDAKQCGERRGLPIGRIEPHQLESLDRHGKAGAITGVLVDATHPAIGAVFWIPTNVVNNCQREGLKAIPWDKPGITRLNGRLNAPNFGAIPAVGIEIIAAGQIKDVRAAVAAAIKRHADDPDQLPLYRTDDGPEGLPRRVGGFVPFVGDVE